jgi:hypothetical protein
VFACLVATGRFAGDTMKARFGAVAIARGCGCAALVGLLVVLAGAKYIYGTGRIWMHRDRRLGRISACGDRLGWSNGSTCGGKRRHPVVYRLARLPRRPAVDRFRRRVLGAAGRVAILLVPLAASLAFTGMLTPRAACRQGEYLGGRSGLNAVTIGCGFR